MPPVTDRRQRLSLDWLCSRLGVTSDQWRQAVAESRFNYCQYPIRDPRSGKLRELCHPPKDSILFAVQKAIQRRLPEPIPLVDEVRGYRKGQHNIGVCSAIAGALYQGTIDISKFHPCITTGHAAEALAKHGVPPAWARRVSRMVTFHNSLPQGAPTSNHIANIVVDGILRRAILPFARTRGVAVLNYDDDIAFAGADPRAVKECVEHATRAFEKAGFRTNEKGRACEHRGDRRLFIGCATGRSSPDYPRSKYRTLRDELRSVLHGFLVPGTCAPRLSDRQLRSLKHRIGYVARMNRSKTRRLMDLFYRICAANRRFFAETYRTLAAHPHSPGSAGPSIAHAEGAERRRVKSVVRSRLFSTARLPTVLNVARIDGDGAPNVLDVCDGTPQGIPVDNQGRPRADLNLDRKVDLRDYAIFQNSMIGP